MHSNDEDNDDEHGGVNRSIYGRNRVALNALNEPQQSTTITDRALHIDDDDDDDYDGDDNERNQTENDNQPIPAPLPTNEPKARKVYEWTELKRFTDEVAYKEYFSALKRWSTGTKLKRKNQSTCYLRCTDVLKKGEQCAAKMRVLMPHDCLLWIVEENNVDHTCGQIGNKISQEVP